MKKLNLILITIIAMIILLPHSYAKNDVKLYMFTKNGCSACEYAFEYFEGKLKENPDAFQLVNIEVWCGTDYTKNNSWITGNETALDLMEKVVAHFGNKIEGTPTIVVGDHFQANTGDLDALYDKILAYRDDKKYKDVVAEIAKENDIDIASLNVPHGTNSCDIYPEEEKNLTSKTDTIIVVSIFVVLIGGFVGLIVVSKK